MIAVRLLLWLVGQVHAFVQTTLLPPLLVVAERGEDPTEDDELAVAEAAGVVPNSEDSPYIRELYAAMALYRDGADITKGARREP